jgi:hypothetical protein
VIDEADELWRIVQAAPVAGLQHIRGPVFHVPSTSSRNSNQPVLWFALMLPAFWFLVWLFGIVFYFRIRKRRLA